MNIFKLTVDSTDIINDEALRIFNYRPENNVSSLALTVNDYKTKHYSDLFDVHVPIELTLYKPPYDQDGTVTFSGFIYAAEPALGASDVMTVQAWGKGIALAKTTCNTSYGTESAFPLLSTVQDIVYDILDNHVEKRWTGAATRWTLDGSDIEDVHNAFAVTNLTSNYLDNFKMVSRVCELANAYAVVNADVSVHWYVDTDGHLRLKEIDQDSTDSEWTHYYGGSATAAVVKEGVNNVSAHGFHKHINDYANHVIVAAGFRKPAYDYWTEDGGPSWGNYQSTDAYSNTQHIVGDESLQVTPTVDASIALVFYPSTHDAAWDFDYVQSRNTVPHLNFYIYVDNSSVPLTDSSSKVVMGKDWNGVVDASGNTILFYYDLDEQIGSADADQWVPVSIPFGDYWQGASGRHGQWHTTAVGGTPDWGDIDFVAISLNNCFIANKWYVDDFHFASKLIRSCYDQSEIAAGPPIVPEHQIFLRMDSAVDDSLVADDDTAGVAAMLAVCELFRRKAKPVIGTLDFATPLPDLLPGQTLQVYAGLYPDGATYRWSNLPMRAKNIVHTVTAAGARTTVEVTSDVTNTFATGVQTQWDLIEEQMAGLNNGEAKDLKNSGVDNLIPRLAWDPT